MDLVNHASNEVSPANLLEELPHLNQPHLNFQRYGYLEGASRARRATGSSTESEYVEGGEEVLGVLLLASEENACKATVTLEGYK